MNTPQTKTELFNALPQLARQEIHIWLHELNVTVGFAHNKLQAFREVAQRLGVSMQTVRRKYYTFRNTGDFLCLADGRTTRTSMRSLRSLAAKNSTPETPKA